LAEDLTDEQLSDLLVCLDFDLGYETLKNGVKVYYLIDLQQGNLSNIEQDILYVNHQDYKKTRWCK